MTIITQRAHIRLLKKINQIVVINSLNDFVARYNSFKQNAYGLANTLMQTANLKPSIKNIHLKNLFYICQLAVAGPGVPPATISCKAAAQQMIKYLS